MRETVVDETRALVDVNNLEKTFLDGGVRALGGITFSLPERDSLAIIGPSGCGKSTLLYVLAGLIEPSAGRVTVKGQEVAGPSRKTAFILQDYGLLPWKSVLDNVCLGMKIQGTERKAREERAERILADLGLAARRDCFPGSLSGGEKQRVAIARALATEPELLLMDEPFSSLDALTRETLQNTVLDLWSREGLSTILVTHNIEEAVFLGRHIMVLSPAPARIRDVIENRGAGTDGYRDSDEFYAMCRKVRKVFEG